jgi:methanethiol oxidase
MRLTAQVVGQSILSQGVLAAEVMANASPSGGLELAKDYWVSFPDGYRAHQIRLEGRRLLNGFVLLPSV